MDAVIPAVYINRVGEPGDNEWCYNIWASGHGALSISSRLSRDGQNYLLKRPGADSFPFSKSEVERYDTLMHEEAMKIAEKMSKRLRLPLEDLTRAELEVMV